jgi:hypothetical protein
MTFTHVPAAPLSITVYPNPATSDVYVGQLPAGTCSLAVYNGFGQMVYSHPAWKKEAGIPVSGWPGGLYRLVIDQRGQRYAGNFMVK